MSDSLPIQTRPFGVQSKRDGTAYYVSEVSECEPGRDIASNSEVRRHVHTTDLIALSLTLACGAQDNQSQ